MRSIYKAGTHGTCLKSNCLYLSPAPADFSYPPIDDNGLIGKMDEVCLTLDTQSHKSIYTGFKGAFKIVNICNCEKH